MERGAIHRGLEWPYKKLLMLQTYYLRQNCTTCNPAHLERRRSDAQPVLLELMSESEAHDASTLSHSRVSSGLTLA